MKVLIVADVVGGVRTFVEELTRGLSGQGVELHLALLGSDRPAAARLAASCESRSLKLEWMTDPWRDVEATSWWIGELSARHRPDVIHMNTFARVLDPDIPVLLTVHSCVTTWWRAVHGADAPSDWTRYRALVRCAVDRAAAVRAPTRAFLDQFTAVHGRLPGTGVIPNGRALSPPLEVPEDRLVVSAGRLWDEAKNAAVVARAAPAVSGHVVMVGPGPVTGDIESLGPLPSHEVLRWLARAAVFVEPARYEPFGLAALEAALCGCALVLGDISSLREVWDDTASYVSPDDPDALARAVNLLLDDPVRGRRAADAARSHAARYTPSAMCQAYLSTYRDLARSALAA
jgi:glycogen synthase